MTHIKVFDAIMETTFVVGFVFAAVCLIIILIMLIMFLYKELKGDD